MRIYNKFHNKFLKTFHFNENGYALEYSSFEEESMYIDVFTAHLLVTILNLYGEDAHVIYGE